MGAADSAAGSAVPERVVDWGMGLAAATAAASDWAAVGSEVLAKAAADSEVVVAAVAAGLVAAAG